ncbi:MAG: hypothetical protein ACTSU6_04780 [Candidatus Njordarchaeales archaeon]
MSDVKDFNHNFVDGFINTPMNRFMDDNRFRKFLKTRRVQDDPHITRDEHSEMLEEFKDSRLVYICGDTKKFCNEESSLDTPISMPFKKILIYSDAEMKFGKNDQTFLKYLLISTEDYINYKAYSVCLDDDNGNNKIIGMIKKFKYDHVCWENMAMRGFVEALSSFDTGEMSFKTKNKIKTKHGKEWFKTNKVIYCCKSKEKVPHGHLSEKIDWKHSWEVRGHWRKTARFGKDPAGNIIKNGFTWVVPHIKGDGVLVKKMRTHMEAV